MEIYHIVPCFDFFAHWAWRTFFEISFRLESNLRNYAQQKFAVIRYSDGQMQRNIKYVGRKTGEDGTVMW